MIIDSHQHTFWQFRDDHGLVKDMDRYGVDQAWLLTWEITKDEQTNKAHRTLNPLNVREDGSHEGVLLRDLITARDRYPDRFVLGYCPHPTNPKAPDMFEAAYHMHDVRVCGEWKCRMPFDDPRCLELYYMAGQLKCPVVLHLDVPYLMTESGAKAYCPDWYGGTLDNLERALAACPDTNFIGHAPGFWRGISGDDRNDPNRYPRTKVTPGGQIYRMFDEYPNLYADMSRSGVVALERDLDHARDFVIKFQDRLLYGRDIYGDHLHRVLVSLDLPEEVKQKVYHDNAAALISQKVPKIMLEP